ncbi:FecR protein [Gimesia panareensis]|uniref:FecR protein n=1 Tax=Gimesia panareensis TaxID=2527978 RepID=A0A517QDM4_9PLAN|nr:LamG-like jellyroll fold domain-containing protein [Gimesia panareensis]QDT29704.1 FecR protein [Gimesia panareensis]
MTDPAPDIREQILELADAQCSGTITAEEMETLEGLLSAHPEYRREYLSYVFVHIGLAGTAQARLLQSPEPEETTVVVPPAEEATNVVERGYLVMLIPIVCSAICLGAVGIFLLMGDFPGLWEPEMVLQERSRYYFDDSASPPEEVASVNQFARARWELLGNNPLVTDRFQPGTVKVTSGEVEFAFSGGADVNVASPSLFGFERKDQGTLFSGSVSTHRSDRKAPFRLETPGIELIDRGTEYEVSVNEASETFVHVLDGQLEVKPRGRLPRFFWNFDQGTDNELTDAIGESPVQAGQNALRVRGLIGPGAVEFNNRPAASLRLGNGGGQEVGTGDYAVSTGITIEALVVSKWQTAETPQARPPFDYDEIFRKEDGSYRILLSFQNDDKAGITQIPKVGDGPCLSFGLYLSGLGYSELDMPLDGKEGRPTLTEIRDGEPHHIVATYNGWTGEKAIYIDGIKRMSHRFPVGTMIISGGAAPAVIGNLISANSETLVGHEPFSGVIDEVAFYDYALDPGTIATHFNLFQAGKDYFDCQLPEFLRQEKQGEYLLLNKGQKMKFSAETGKPVL